MSGKFPESVRHNWAKWLYVMYQRFAHLCLRNFVWKAILSTSVFYSQPQKNTTWNFLVVKMYKWQSRRQSRHISSRYYHRTRPLQISLAVLPSYEPPLRRNTSRLLAPAPAFGLLCSPVGHYFQMCPFFPLSRATEMCLQKPNKCTGEMPRKRGSPLGSLSTQLGPWCSSVVTYSPETGW